MIDDDSRHTTPSFDWEMISGRELILAQKALLVALAKRCSQEGVLDFLDHLIEEPYFILDVPQLRPWVVSPLLGSLTMRRSKLPRLLLRRSSSQVDAAVLLFEYALHGVGTRCFIPFDEDGYRSVIAPARDRAEVVLQAGDVLVKRGAVLALISYMDEQPGVEFDARTSRLLLGSQSCETRRKLQLSPSYEETLAAMSRNTRHNLRRAKDQLTQRFGAVFSTSVDLSETEILELNGDSSFAPPSWAALERYTAARTFEHGVLVGVKAADGRWLSLIGAHREHDTLCLDWQLNRSSLGNISVATAARAFLLEAETESKSKCIRFERGTTHPISRAFLLEQTHDLVFAPRLLPSWFIKALFSGAKGGLLPTILASRSLLWHR